MRWSTAAGILVGLLVWSDVARAHVRYVAEADASTAAVWTFVASVLSVPMNAALVGLGSVGVVGSIAWYHWTRPAEQDVAALRSAVEAYRPFLPWMLRLSVGLPLLGAGFAGYFFTPAVPTSVRVPQVTLGFLLLFGLATRATAVVGLGLFLVGLVRNPAFLLVSEFVGGFVAIVLLGAGRPSADHLLKGVAETEGTLYGRIDPVHRAADRFNAAVDPFEQYAPVAVRLTLGATFVYLGLWEKLAHPERALSVVAKYDLTALVPVDPGLWVLGAAAVEIAVGVLLVLGLFTRAAAAAGFLALTLTLFGLPDDPVLAHITLFGLTSVLFVTGAGPRSVDDWLCNRRSPGRSVPSPG